MNSHYGMNPLFWQRNIEALERHDAELAHRVKNAASTDKIIIGRAGDGSPLLAIPGEGGKPLALAHTGQPMGEAEKWVNGLGEELRKGAHVLLVGIGSGYHSLAFHRMLDTESALWIVEPDLSLFKTVLQLIELTPLITSPRVQWAVGFSEIEVARKLFTGVWEHRMRVQGIRVLFTGVSRHIYHDYIQNLGNAIREAIQMEGLKLRTAEAQSSAILSNVLTNLPAVLQGAPWKRLMGKSPGIPALVLAPGPSLEEAIPHLHAYRDRALFLAVDTAHKILVRKNIVSDGVVSLDFTELNARHFDTLEKDEAILFAFPGVHPSIPLRYLGRTFFYDHSGSVDFGAGATPLHKSLPSLGGLGDLISFGSTAHIALHAARLMGCSPIVLVGNDLAFPDSRWYAAGAMQNELTQTEREREPLLSVPANDGRKVFTSGLYKHYLETFGELIRASAALVINTSPKGAKIENTIWMPLPDVLDSYCRETIDRSFLSESLIPNLVEKRRGVLLELKALADACGQAQHSLERLIERQRSLDPFSPHFRNSMIQIMKDFTELLRNESTAFNLSMGLCSRSTLSLLGQSGSSQLFGGEDPQINRQALQRCSDLFLDLHRALKINEERIRESVPR